MSQDEKKDAKNDKNDKKPEKLDPKGNTTSTKDVPQEGEIVGASQPQQGTWQAPKGGEMIAPPERGHVEKPLEGKDEKTNEQ